MQLPVLAVIMLVPIFLRERPGDRRFPWDATGGEVPTSVESDTMSFSDIVSGLRSALSGGAPAWALMFAVMMWIGGGMGAGMGLIDIQFPFLFIEELGWSDTEVPRPEGRPDHLGHLVRCFDRRRTRAPFWHQDRAVVGHHRRWDTDRLVVPYSGTMG